MPGFGIAHSILIRIASFAVDSFFHEIKIVGGENVPTEGGVVLACSHFNMAIDPACLSYAVSKAVKGESKRYIHYWVKDSLFKNPIAGAILLNAGNIPVDRKNKDNQKLFRGTFEALKEGEVIGVFPEGTSHTHSRLIPIKDGVSWTALEYVKFLEDNHGGVALNEGDSGHRAAVIVPVGVVYSDKTKYRSRVVVEFGKPIDMSAYAAQFLSTEEGAPKAAVKRLTKHVQEEMEELTVNAEDWDTLNAAAMARALLWDDEEDLRMEDFVEVTQTLVDIFTTPASPDTPSPPTVDSLKQTLNSYHNYLTTARMSSSSLSRLPLPSNLDPSRPIPLPTRAGTVGVLLKDLVASLIRLPFFALPFLLNIPIYLMARLGAGLVQDEEETIAQMKLAFGVVISILLYPILAVGLFFAVFRTNPFFGGLVGLFVAGLIAWGLIMYHLSLIDDNYEHARRLVTAFRILIGIWSPQTSDVVLPPPTLTRSPSQAHLNNTTSLADSNSSSNQTSIMPPPAPPSSSLKPSSPSPSSSPNPLERSEPPAYEPNKPRIPSRRLIRQVLRTRMRAAKGLEAFLLKLEEEDGDVRSTGWLAASMTKGEERRERDEGELAQGLRGGKEVVAFLRERGAKIMSGLAARRKGHMAEWLEALEEESGPVAGRGGEEKKER